MAEQKDGCYPRVNGGMIQTNQYTGMIVSVVGKLIDHNTLQTADGSNITLNTENIIDGVVVNPDLCIEIIGSVNDATSVTAFVSRDLSSDMDLGLYNQMINIQQAQAFSHYFSSPISN